MNKLKIFNKIILAVVFVILAGGFINVSKAEAWYNASWSYRIKITVDYTKVPSNQTNFPVYVDLANLPAGFHTHVNQTDARDIRITKADGNTELPREVVFYTAASDTGELYFKADSLSSTVNTDFYIYYGNSGATEPAANSAYGSQNVWDSNYLFVHHYGNGSTLSLTDSTANANNGINSGATAVAGKTGGAVAMSGVNQIYTIADKVQFRSLTALSIEVWGYLVASDTTGYFFLTKNVNDVTPADPYEDIAFFGDTTRNTIFRLSSSPTTGWTDNTQAAAYMPLTTWTGLAATYDGSTMRTYKNGAVSATTTSISRTTGVNTNPLRVGDFGPAGYAYDYNGKMDEMRMSNIARSGTWLSTQYNNQNSPSTFYVVGSEEAYGPIGYWSLDEGAGIYANDSSGNVNTGTLLGSTLPTWVVGKFGNSLSFNGTTAYVSVADSASLRGMSQLTLSAWVNKSTKDIKVFGKWNGGNNYILRETAGQIQFYTGTTNGVIGGNTGLVGSTGWHFYVVTYDGTTMKAYKDGVVGGTTYNQTGSISNTPGSNLIIGAEYDISLPQDGLIDDLHIYNRAFSPTEVSELYNWSPATAPTVATNAESNLASYKVTFNGSANPNGSQAYGYFRYFTGGAPNCTSDAGGTRVPSSSAADYDLGNGSAPVSFNIATSTVIPLIPNTAYWYCAYARNVVAGEGSPGTSAAAGYDTFTTPDGGSSGCDAPASGNLTIAESCTFPQTDFDGVDGGGAGNSNNALVYLVAGGNISILPGQVLSRGGVITNGGSFSSGNGNSGFVQGGLWLKDSDGDGIIDNPIVKLVRMTQPTGYIRRNYAYTFPTYNSTTFNYASKFYNAATNASSSLDCDSTNALIYRNVANLVRDADNDGYKTAAAAGVQCVGAQATFNGRTYYNDGTGPN